MNLVVVDFSVAPMLKLGNDDNVVGQSVGSGGAVCLLEHSVLEPWVRQDLSWARSSRRVLSQAGRNLNRTGQSCICQATSYTPLWSGLD